MSAVTVLEAALCLALRRGEPEEAPFPLPIEGEDYQCWSDRLRAWSSSVSAATNYALPFLGNGALAYDAALVLRSILKRDALCVAAWRRGLASADIATVVLPDADVELMSCGGVS